MKMPTVKAKMPIEGVGTGFTENDRIPSTDSCHLVFDIHIV